MRPIKKFTKRDLIKKNKKIPKPRVNSKRQMEYGQKRNWPKKPIFTHPNY